MLITWLYPPERVPISAPLLGPIRRWRFDMTDELWIAAVATACSVVAYAWYDANGLTHLFNDAQSRELIARRVLAGRTPGLAQLGNTWLPLSSMLSLPLIWNDPLFRSGIAGSLPSMVAYVAASVYLYRIGRLVTSSRGAGTVAAGAFMLNPSVLYMQSTAMSETITSSAFVVAIYYALRLTHTHDAASVVKCAAAVAAGTLSRYENWVLALALVPLVAYAGWRHGGYVLAEAWTILYGLLGLAGCVGWVLYNAVVFHDPLLSFFYGQSSHSYYANTPDSFLPARHRPWVAVEMYGYTVVGTIGWIIVAMALLGFFVFAWRARLRLKALPAYLTLVPFGFYWLVLSMGVNTETLPEPGRWRQELGLPLPDVRLTNYFNDYYNIRFGLMMVPAAALFLAFLIMIFPASWRRGVVAVVVSVIALSSIANSALQTPFVLREALSGGGALSDRQQSGQLQARWLSSHYRGGNVLVAYTTDSNMLFPLLTQYNLPDRVFITDANGQQFAEALQRPERHVTWIVMTSPPSDGSTPSSIWGLHDRQDWRPYFVLRQIFHTRADTTEIYEASALAAGVPAEAPAGE